MKKLSWIITIPVTVVCVIFAIANQESVALDLWPLDMTYSLPIFLLVLGCLFVGFLIGATVMWVSAGTLRDKARRSYYKAADLEREVNWLKRKQLPQQGGSPVPVAGQLPAAPQQS